MPLSPIIHKGKYGKKTYTRIGTETELNYVRKWATCSFTTAEIVQTKKPTFMLPKRWRRNRSVQELLTTDRMYQLFPRMYHLCSKLCSLIQPLTTKHSCHFCMIYTLNRLESHTPWDALAHNILPEPQQCRSPSFSSLASFYWDCLRLAEDIWLTMAL